MIVIPVLGWANASWREWVVGVSHLDLDTVGGVLRALPHAREVQVKSPPGAPVFQVRLRPDRVTELGFRPLEVLDE